MKQITQPNRSARLVLLLGLGFLAACTGDFWDRMTGSGTPTQIATSKPTPLTPAAGPATEEQVAKAQTLLRELGFDPGPVDGKTGPRTTAAVEAFQANAGLEADGQVSVSLLEWLEAKVRSGQIAKAQRQLSALGYEPGPADGEIGPRTEAAIMAFQVASGKPRDGRITPDLLTDLDGAQAVAAARTAGTETAGTETAGTETAGTETADTEAADTEAAKVEAAAVETAAAESAEAEMTTAAAEATGAGATAGAAATNAEAAAETVTAEAEGAVEDTVEPAAAASQQVAALTQPAGALAPGDRVLLGYLGTKDKPVEIQVGDDGRLTLPEAGSVQAAGLALSELRDRVTVKLIEAYMGSVDVKVGVAGAGTAGQGAQVVAAGDRILLSLSGDQATAQEIEIGSDGRLGLPDAGAVQAAGLGLAELEEEISVKLLESYMDKLDVRIERAE